MGVAWRYWRWVRIDAAQGRVVLPLPAVRDFYRQQFGYCADEEQVNDQVSQMALIQQWQYGSDAMHQRLAEAALRCFISMQIDWVCMDLASRFGQIGNFSQSDLLPMVLDDVSVEDLLNPDKPNLDKSLSRDSSLATQILQSFDFKKARLATWCRQRVISHPELARFLNTNGIYLESDWSILNNTRPEQLHRILQQIYTLSSARIQESVTLLKSYHAVYRSDRLKQHQTQGTRGRCQPPTDEQCDRISAHFQSQGEAALSSNEVLEQLQLIARLIRLSRRPQTVPLEETTLSALTQPEPDPTEEAQNSFLTQYRGVLQSALKSAIAQVIQSRVTYHQRKKPPRDRAFLLALWLLHCQGKAMGEIAAQVKLKEQYQVSRLLELKALRADVRRTLLGELGDRIRELATDYIDPERLHQIDVTLDAALAEEVDAMITAAEKETTTAQAFRSTLFSQILCGYLDGAESFKE